MAIYCNWGKPSTTRELNQASNLGNAHNTYYSVLKSFISLAGTRVMKISSVACADPGIFVRGVQVNLTKRSDNVFFFLFFFFSPQFILQKSNG